ncbi:MAG: efflux RND transporter periplasmic adaptor subunit [Beijerinckiaceae bacterium]
MALRVAYFFAVIGIVGLPSAAAANEPSALRGVVRAVHEAAISSDMATRVTALPFREGEAFKKDDVLVEFDCERLRADLKAADAERRGHHAAWENSARLFQLRAAGAHEVSMAAATHDKSAAMLEGLQARVKQCRILAPFDGRILDLTVRRHETPSPNQPLIRILDDKSLEIDMLLPASAINSIKPGTPFTLTLDDTGQRLSGEITRVSPALDIVSQTFKASGVPKSDLKSVLPGMSGSITLGKGAM